MPLKVKKIRVGFPSYDSSVDGDMLFNIDAEAWARGTQNGEVIPDPNPINLNVPSQSNNAKYYSDQTAAVAADIMASVVENTQAAVDEWMDEHSGSYVIPDGNISEAKLSDNLKLKTINNYVTPEMFGAWGDGVHDDAEYVQAALDAGGVILCAKTYKIESPVYVKSNSYVQINKLIYNKDDSLTYDKDDSALWLDNVQNTVIQLGEIVATKGTGIHVEVTGLRGGTIRNNTNIRIFGGHIRAYIGIDMVSDPDVQHRNGYNGVAGNQEISFFGTNITVNKIESESENNVEQGIGVRFYGPTRNIGGNNRTGWNGEINFFGGAVRRYSATDWPTAFQTEGYNTGLYLSSVSVESCDVYFDMSGEVQKFYAINCRDERRENSEHYKNKPYTGSDGNPALYPIKIHDITGQSKFYFISDRFVPEDFDIDTETVGYPVSIRISGIIAQRGVPDQLDGFRYYSGTGWSQDPTIYPSVRYTNTIASGLIQRSGTAVEDKRYDGAYLPVFGYKSSAKTVNKVNLPAADVDLIRARGLPVYMYICAGCTLTIGDETVNGESNVNLDMFFIDEDSYIMLLPQGTPNGAELTLAGRQIHNGLVPVRISSVDQDTEFKELTLVTAMEGPSDQVTFTEAAARRIQSLIVDAKVQQSGSGDPSPSNIRSFLPLSEVKIVVSPTSREENGEESGQEYSVNIPVTVGNIGGAMFDVAKGVLIKTYAYQILDGTESWTSYGGASYFGTGSSEETKLQYGAGTGFCSHFKWGLAQTTAAANTMCTYASDASFPNGRIVIKTGDNITTVEELKTWLAEQKARGTPVTVIYKLKNPVSVNISESFTPASIYSIVGVNNVWSENGQVTVSHTASVAEYVNQAVAEVLPEQPSQDGTYYLKATVSNGNVSYAWTTTT